MAALPKDSELQILENLAQKVFKSKTINLTKDSGSYKLIDNKLNKVYISTFDIKNIYNFLEKQVK